MQDRSFAARPPFPLFEKFRRPSTLSHPLGADNAGGDIEMLGVQAPTGRPIRGLRPLSSITQNECSHDTHVVLEESAPYKFLPESEAVRDTYLLGTLTITVSHALNSHPS